MKIGDYNKEFRVGDKVKIVMCNDGCDFCKDFGGETGRIIGIDKYDNGIIEYDIRRNIGSTLVTFNSHIKKWENK